MPSKNHRFTYLSLKGTVEKIVRADTRNATNPDLTYYESHTRNTTDGTDTKDISRNCEESIFSCSTKTSSVNRSLDISLLIDELQTFLQQAQTAVDAAKYHTRYREGRGIEGEHGKIALSERSRTS
jgi:hypothetical protein